MRLEDWQKFIESQFLEEPSESRTALGTETVADLAETPEQNSGPDTAAGAPELQVSMPVEPAQSLGLTHREAPDLQDSAPDPLRLSARDVDHSLPFGTAPTFDTEVPRFDDYLPTGHSQSRADSTNGRLAPQERQVTGVREVAESKFDESVASIPSALDNLDDGTSQRTPRLRARGARNVQPETNSGSRSLTEIWSKVPRHVETLLALGRLEEDQEIAQYSYKRPFTEKRQELIERLLDPILSLEETARLLNVCPTTIRRYTNKGILTHIRKEPNAVSSPTSLENKETRQRRFRLSDILLFLETQEAAIEADRKTDAARARRNEADDDFES